MAAHPTTTTQEAAMPNTFTPRRTPDEAVTLTTWTIVVRGVFAGDVEGPGELAHTRGFLLRLIDEDHDKAMAV